MNAMIAPAAAGTVDLNSGWDSVWGAFKAGAPGISTAMTVIGVVLVVFSILKWAWDRRRNQGGNHSNLLWTLVPGAVLVAPDLLFPLILTLLDWIINIAVQLINHGTGSH